MFDVTRSRGTHMYSDAEKNVSGYDFRTSVRKEKMLFSQFVDEVATPCCDPLEAEARRAEDDGKVRDDSIYLKHELYLEIGDKLQPDLQTIDWTWALAMKQALGFGKMTSNLLLIGERGTITPCHYDEQHNLYAQVHGGKRVTVIPPDQFANMYPHPLGHAADRQTMVDMYGLFANAALAAI